MTLCPEGKVCVSAKAGSSGLQRCSRNLEGLARGSAPDTEGVVCWVRTQSSRYLCGPLRHLWHACMCNAFLPVRIGLLRLALQQNCRRELSQRVLQLCRQCRLWDASRGLIWRAVHHYTVPCCHLRISCLCSALTGCLLLLKRITILFLQSRRQSATKANPCFMGFRALSFLSQGGRNAVLLEVMASLRTALIYAPVGMLAYWFCCWHSTKAWRSAAWPALRPPAQLPHVSAGQGCC